MQYLHSIGPLFSGGSRCANTTISKQNNVRIVAAKHHRFWCRHISLFTVHCGFVMWGIVVLICHVQASLKTPLFECNPKVKPIFAGTGPACFAVEFNCHEIDSGTKDEVIEVGKV